MPTQYDEDTLREMALVYRERQLQAAKQYATAVWTPRSHPQRAALTTQADELFYGGAAGGGKSDLLIGAALTQHRKSIIFRREFPQLRDIITRTEEIITTSPSSPSPPSPPHNSSLQANAIGPKYNQSLHIWRNLPGKRTLEFGAVVHEKDRFKYQGRPHDLKGFDEITQFTLTQYKYIIGWLRSTVPNQRKRVIATGNPPSDTEGLWTIDYWAPWLDDSHPDYPAPPNQLRYYVTVKGKDKEVDSPRPFYHKSILLRPMSRTFIPASLSDNPFLRDTEYASVVNSLPEPLRSQLLFGDFSIKPAADRWQLIPREWVKAANKRWLDNPNPNTGITVIGHDVARGGSDRTCNALRFTDYIAPLHVTDGTDTPDGTSAARTLLTAVGVDPDTLETTSWYGSRIGEIPINADVIGVGASSYDVLHKAGFNVYDVNFSVPSQETDHSGTLTLLNLRAEAYWNLREQLDPGLNATLRLPPDKELEDELCVAKWEPTIRGIKIQDKEAISLVLGRSPDKADAVALTTLNMVLKRSVHIPLSHSTRQIAPTSRNPAIVSNPSTNARKTPPSGAVGSSVPYNQPPQQHPNSSGQRVRIIYDAYGNQRTVTED